MELKLPRMSTFFVDFRRATEWFEKGKIVAEEIEKEEKDLVDREAEWKKEQMERQKKIKGLEGQIQHHYGRKDNIQRNKKIIANYNTHMSTEEEIMKKMEYATKCLEFIIIQIQKCCLLKNCMVGDELTHGINKLSVFMERSNGELGIPDKFIKLYKKDGSVEVNLPSIYDLRREGFSTDDVIGLAHLQFIGGVRENADMDFEFVSSWKTSSYHGVAFPPEYFFKNERLWREGKDWRSYIEDEKPARMYIGGQAKCESVRSMEDILEDGRLYDNRFGIRYDSTPGKVYWDY